MSELKSNPLIDQFEKANADREADKKTKDKFKSHLLYLNERFIEEGQTDHIITTHDLAVALNTSDQEVRNMLRRAYGISSLNDILAAAGLPHRKSK